MAAGPSIPALVRRIRADGAKIGVLLGPEDGSYPGAGDEVDYLNVTRISRSLGADKMDSISMEWDLGLSNKRLVDTMTPVGHNRVVVVYALHRPTPYAPMRPKKLAWGVISEEGQYLDAEREMIQVTTRIDPWLIGTSVSGWWLHHSDDTRQFVQGDIVFNPLDEQDRIVGNMAGSERVSNGLLSGDSSLVRWWVYPSSFRTAPAIAAQVNGPISQAKWTLAHVVHSLCWMLNPDETHILNPVLSDLTDTFTVAGVDADDLVRNLKVDVGESLPHALDKVLAPYGFLWGIEHQDFPLVPWQSAWLKSKFVFVRKNEGPEAKFKMVRPGDYIDRINTTVADYWANISIADLTNRVEGMTGPIRVESTFELFCGFAATDPPTAPKELDKEDERANGVEMRLFVLNEAGDFTDLRPEITAATGLDALLGQDDVEGNSRQVAARRRTFEKCLTLTAQASDETSKIEVDRSPVGRNGYELQFRRHIKEGAAETEVQDDWKTVDWPFEVLDEMCAIRLTGKIPPELWRTVNDYPQDKPLRLTACIDSDFSVHKAATRQETSPNGLDVTTVLDLSSKFHVRKVDSTSRFYSDRHFTITTVNLPSTLSVSGMDVDQQPSTGDSVQIVGGGNAGVYTVASAVPGVVIVDETFPSAVAGGVLAVWTDEVDDTEDMLEHLERLRDADDAADVSCSLMMDRIDLGTFDLGNVVKKLSGRNLQLTGQVSSGEAGGERRPLQIVGINWEMGPTTQTTEVLLDSSRAERVTFERET